MSVHVTLIDPHATVCASLRTFLGEKPDVKVVASTTEGKSSLRLAQRSCSDVVLLEATYPDVSGSKVVRKIANCEETGHPLVVSRLEEQEIVQELLGCGAQGYLLKKDPPSLLVEAIRGVASNQDGWLSPSLTIPLTGGSSSIRTIRHCLTQREREVLYCVSEGLRNNDIAVKLSISKGTVKNHVHNILQKLDMSSRLELIVWVYQQGVYSFLSFPEEAP